MPFFCVDYIRSLSSEIIKRKDGKLRNLEIGTVRLLIVLAIQGHVSPHPNRRRRCTVLVALTLFQLELSRALLLLPLLLPPLCPSVLEPYLKHCVNPNPR